MTIKRNINGIEVEITLTEGELWQAYVEEQHNCDISDISMVFEDMDEEEIEDTYETPWSEIEPLIPEMAQRYRETMDNSDVWSYKRDSAIEYVLGL